MALAHAHAEPDCLGEIIREGSGRHAIRRAAHSEPSVLRTGVDSFDRALEGGLPVGVLAEVAAPAPSSGAQTVMLVLIDSIRRQRGIAALIDGSDRFDPATCPPALLEHLLWTRCHDPKQALAAADTLMRDDNVSLVLLDLREADRRFWRRAPATDWYRLQRLAHHSSITLAVFTSQPAIPSAQVRLELNGSLTLAQSHHSLLQIAHQLHPQATRLRRNANPQSFPNLIEIHHPSLSAG